MLLHALEKALARYKESGNDVKAAVLKILYYIQ